MGFLLSTGFSSANAVEAVMDLTKGKGADRILVACPSASAQTQALDMVAKLGVVNLFAVLPKRENHDPQVPLTTNRLHYRPAMIYGSHSCTPAQFRDAYSFIEQHPELSQLVSHGLPLRDIKDGFALAGTEQARKVIVKPNA